MKNFGVLLPVPSASKVVWNILKQTCSAFPETFSTYTHSESSKVFSKKYAMYLSQFEVARALSPQRTEIARFITDLMHTSFFFDTNEVSLQQHMKQKTESILLNTLEYSYAKNTEGYRYHLAHDGKIYDIEQDLLQLPEYLLKNDTISPRAKDALTWINEYLFNDQKKGYLNLRGHKFVLLGGTAELSPLQALLKAGADVLTTNVRDLDKKIQSIGTFSGRLYYSPTGMNLLTEPAKIAQTIREFAGSDKVHIVALAYQGGKGRELRIMAAIDAIIRHIKDNTLSVAYYLSPAIVSAIPSALALKSQEKYKEPLKLQQKIVKLMSLGTWYKKNIYEKDNNYWSLSICNFQGCSYAAANLFGKYYCAEVHHQDGIAVSANVGPITATSSMDTPFLRAAFKEARRFNLEIFETEETKGFMQALWFHDILKKNKKQQTTAEVFAKQVHGGLFTNAWQINGLVEKAAITGNIKRILTIGENSHIQHWLNKLRKGCDKQVITVKNATKFEYTVRHLPGTLARAFTGGKGHKPATYLYLGESRAIPRKMARLLPVFSRMNRIPLLGRWIMKWGQGKKIYGNLLTTILWNQYKKPDRISLSTNKNGELHTVRLHKLNGQDLEFSLKENNIITQKLYFGRPLKDNSEFISIDYTYNPQSGTLKTTGPTAVNSQSIKEAVSLSPFEITESIIREFERLTKQKTQSSVTFPINTGILEEALEQLKSPEWQVDFTRVTVYSATFENEENTVSDFAAKVINTSIEPKSVVQTDKGEIITTEIATYIDDKCFHKATISLLIRGNFPQEKQQDIPHISYKNLGDQGHKTELTSMDSLNLIDFAALNGDHNPLHQIKGAAQMVGFKDIINPGLGTLCQIESCLRKVQNQNIKKLTGTIVRPTYPSTQYTLEYKENINNEWEYQLIEAKNNKVLIDGMFIAR